MGKYWSIFFVIICIFTSCIRKGGGRVVMNDGVASIDSFSLQRIDTLTLHIGNRIKPIPTCSQLINDTTAAKYIILDEQKLNIFSLDADSLIAIIDVSKCGGLKNYSGFICASNGEFYLYDYKTKTIFEVTPDGSVSNACQIPENVVKVVSPEPIDGSRMIVEDGIAILSGIPLSDKQRFLEEDPISVSIDTRTGKIKTGAYFSDEYRNAFFGGLYFNTVYQCKGDNKKIVYSFPASNYIYRYDMDLNMVDSLYMGSRYTKEIKPCNSSPIGILSDKDKRLNYYIGENSYSVIAFDEINGLYYRIANHPRILERKDNYRMPFSIIVMDKNGNLLAETPIVEDYPNIVTVNSHVHRGGLIIQMITEDENEMKFVHYKLVPQL